jgi:hypothetical protein
MRQDGKRTRRHRNQWWRCRRPSRRCGAALISHAIGAIVAQIANERRQGLSSASSRRFAVHPIYDDAGLANALSRKVRNAGDFLPPEHSHEGLLASACIVSSAESRSNLDDSPIELDFRGQTRGRLMVTQIPQAPLPVRNAPLRAAHRADPHDGVVEGPHRFNRPLLALEAPRCRKGVGRGA